MAIRVGIWAFLVAIGLGCHAQHRSAPVYRPESPPPVPPELPLITPVAPAPDLDAAPMSLPRPDDATKPTFRELTAPVCRRFAAQFAPSANMLEDENRLPDSADGCDTPAGRLRQTVRHFAAIEARNQEAAAALERFFQLVEAEGRTALLREAVPILTGLRAKAEGAKAAGVRFPLDAAELSRMLSQADSHRAQADGTIRMLNIDLRRRIGLPPAPAAERLWPTGDFQIEPQPVSPEQAAAAAHAERPEVQAWRALEQGLNLDTLPVARDLLSGSSSGTGAAPSRGVLARCVLNLRTRQAGPATAGELIVRKKQVHDMLMARERQVGDEARAAAESINAQAHRVVLAQDRATAWKTKLDDVEMQQKAGLPNAEVIVAQTRLEWMRARSELIAEVMAWHQAHVRLQAAIGRLHSP